MANRKDAARRGAKATMNDIAGVACVTKKTVSCVVNRSRLRSEERRSAAYKLVGALTPHPEASEPSMFISSLVRRASVAPPPER